MLAKGIKFYVGKFELSDMKISLRLTIEDNSKWNAKHFQMDKK